VTIREKLGSAWLVNDRFLRQNVTVQVWVSGRQRDWAGEPEHFLQSLTGTGEERVMPDHPPPSGDRGEFSPTAKKGSKKGDAGGGGGGL